MRESDSSGSRPVRPYVLVFTVDHEVEQGAVEILADVPVHPVRSMAAARALLGRAVPPAMVVVTIDGGESTGVSIARIAREAWPRTAVVLLARGRGPRVDVDGAELISVSGDPSGVLSSLRPRALEGLRVREAQRALADVFAVRWRLSRRQQDCVRLLAFGVAQSELAARLGVTQGTVDQHLRALRERCGEVESCGLIQRLLGLALEAGLRGESWLGVLRGHEALTLVK